TWNVQSAASGQIPGARFLTQGSTQAWVLADPVRPGNIYVITADGGNSNNDPSDVVIARSQNFGAPNSWTRSFVDTGTFVGGLGRRGPRNFQLSRTAATDNPGNSVVAWSDNRRGLTNADGHFLLDVFARYSTDGGVSWSPAFQVNDENNPFDPDPGAPFGHSG